MHRYRIFMSLKTFTFAHFSGYSSEWVKTLLFFLVFFSRPLILGECTLNFFCKKQVVFWCFFLGLRKKKCPKSSVCVWWGKLFRWKKIRYLCGGVPWFGDSLIILVRTGWHGAHRNPCQIKITHILSSWDNCKNAPSPKPKNCLQILDNARFFSYNKIAHFCENEDNLYFASSPPPPIPFLAETNYAWFFFEKIL